MNLSSYIADLEKNKKLSQVKRLILRLLYEKREDNNQWVESQTLLEATQQKYFDRRIRELRDEHGCDVETTNDGGNHKYRLRSLVLNTANPRTYLSNKEKASLFESSNYCCDICGREVAAGPRGLQADHRIPLKRGGEHSKGNWQSLCNECNVAKRRNCQDCLADCHTCNWAFPDKTGFQLTISLDKMTHTKVSEELKKDPNWLRDKLKNSFNLV